MLDWLCHGRDVQRFRTHHRRDMRVSSSFVARREGGTAERVTTESSRRQLTGQPDVMFGFWSPAELS